ncbi:uncharacterized protein [Arachis hypogaea]|uniref:uncharacterized protein n=1 Tax=Arachis hypogaea TaxID=3818 RepID=UPI003B211A8C
MDSQQGDLGNATPNVNLNTLSQLLLQITQLHNRLNQPSIHPSADPNSPYFLHPGESPGNPIISFRLNSQNYTTWSTSIWLVLKSKNKIPFIDGSLPRPEISDPLFTAWDRYILQSVIWRNDASDLWNDLRRRYYQGDLYHVSELYEELYNAKKGDLNITSYFTKMKGLWEEIDNFRPIPLCTTCTSDCNCGLGVMRFYRNEDYIARFLRGLNEQFSTAKTQIMLQKPLPDIDTVFSMLTQQERQFSPSLDLQDSKILYAATQGQNSNRGRGRGREGTTGRGRGQGRGYNTKHCSFCGKTGHIIDTCYKKHGLPPHLQRNGAANNTFTDEVDETSDSQNANVKEGESSAYSLTNDQRNALMSLLHRSTPPSSTINQISIQQPKDLNITQGTILAVSLSVNKKFFKSGAWVIDTDNSEAPSPTMHAMPNSSVHWDDLFTHDLYTHLQFTQSDNTNHTSAHPVIPINNVSPLSPSISLHSTENNAPPLPLHSLEHNPVEHIDRSSHLRRSTRVKRPPVYLKDFQCANSITTQQSIQSSNCKYPISNSVSYSSLSSTQLSFSLAVTTVDEPKIYEDAIKEDYWRKAISAELLALEQTKTWSLTPLPHGRRQSDAVGLVAKGYTQRFGLDYLDTFSPVVKITTVRLVLALTAIYGWHCHQLDVNTAFLHGDLKETVYMRPPPGLPISSPDLVCKLDKSLYGLKQASRQWNLKLCSVLLTHGYKQSKTDYSLFTKLTANSSFTVILAYVDDLVLAGNDLTEIQSIKTIFDVQFKIKDLGNLKYFLGFEVARTKAGISLYQRKYALDLLEECGLLGAKPTSTPMEYTLKLSKESGSPLTDVKQYRRLIGRLVYLTNTT